MTNPPRDEDELRAAMRAHDADAPSATAFHPYVRPPKRMIATVAAAAVVALIAAALAVSGQHREGTDTGLIAPTVTVAPASTSSGTTTSSDTSTSTAPHDDGLTCPQQYSNDDATAGRVPAAPTGFDASTRLVPSQAPTSALLCDYRGMPNQQGIGLHGSRTLTGDLGAVADTLPWVPPVSPRATVACATVAVRITDTYLIGLVYRSGVVWVDVPGGCPGETTNGTFSTLADVGALAAHAYQHGTWPDTSTGGRYGQQTQMVPGTPTSVTIDKQLATSHYGENPHRQSRTLTTGFDSLVAALNAAPTSASTMSCSHSPRDGAAEDDLYFRYAVGPGVHVRLMQGCFPEVDNDNLQIHDGSAFFTMIDRLIGPHRR